jgi:alkylhydroperoxidase/carboxymuconolactone decarboxylase family protein YurZ
VKYSPEYFENIKKLYPRVAEGFDQLAREIATGGPLDGKQQLLVKLGIAIGIGSEGDVQNLASQALVDGISAEDLRHAVLLTVTTAGFPAMIVAMQWVEEIISCGPKPRAE